MTSLVAGGLSNAIAFAGAGFLFSKINQNLANLAKAMEVWYESEVANKDRIQQLRQQLSDANSDINDTNHALDVLRQVEVNGRTFSEQPQLNDYYEPSDEMKEYQTFFVGIVGLGGGFMISKFVA